MRRSLLFYLPAILSLAVAAVAAVQDSNKPCCSAVDFQAFGAVGVKIQLLQIKRTAPADVTVTWQYMNGGKTAQPLSQGGAGAAWVAYRLSWDAELLDMASGTKYRISRDMKTQTPMAAKHTPGSRGAIMLAGGQTLKTWAKFSLPDSVTKVTVTIPGASEPWENVEVKP
jgi:hypothetical protein